MIDLYTREGCEACQRIKEQFNVLKVAYRMHEIGKDVSKDYVKENFPGASQLPIAVMAGSGVVLSGPMAIYAMLNEYGNDIGKELLNENNWENEGGKV